MIRNVKLLGFEALEAKLDAKILVQPELDDAVATFTGRMLRGGKGLGVQRNTLASTVQPLGSKVTSTLTFPRTRGTAWGRKNEAAVKGMAPNVLKKAVARIEARWAAGNGGAA